MGMALFAVIFGGTPGYPEQYGCLEPRPGPGSGEYSWLNRMGCANDGRWEQGGIVPRELTIGNMQATLAQPGPPEINELRESMTRQNGACYDSSHSRFYTRPWTPSRLASKFFASDCLRWMLPKTLSRATAFA